MVIAPASPVKENDGLRIVGHGDFEMPRLYRLEDNLVAACFSLMKLLPAGAILNDALARGELQPGGSIIETTSGSFGLALAIHSSARGFHLTIVTDSTATDIRLRRQLLLMGVDLRVVTKPHPSGGMQRARLDVLHRCLQKNPNIYWTQQYSNPKNAEAYGRYAEHLFERLGRVDCLVGSVGTGGSMVGTVRRARQLSPQLHAIAVDTCHSVLFGQSDGRRLVRGMGNSIIPDMLDHTQFDSVSWMPAPATFEATRELLRTHGLFMGPTSGAAYQVARWWARSHPDQLVVVTMADAGHRYVDTVYSDKWVKRTLPWPTPIDPEPRQVITPKAGEECWSWMQWSRRRLSDLPVVTADQP
jgi:cysteine synthase A